MKKRLPALGVAAACVGTVVAAVSGGIAPSSALAFLPPGQWIYHAGLGSLFHVDGATGTIDARIEDVKTQPGSEVVQHGTKGYVVGEDVTIVDLPSLSVEKSVEPPSDEVGVTVRTSVGPHTVYPKAGTIARLGDPIGVIAAGGPVQGAVATPDGRMWLRRTDTGALCTLPPLGQAVTCPIEVSKNAAGALTVVAGAPVFINTSTDTAQPVRENGLGAAVALGFDVPDGAVAAASDVSGRIAVLDREHDTLHLVDPGLNGSTVDTVTVKLPEGGDFEGPMSAGSVVALVDKKRNVLLTFDGDGAPHGTKPIPPDTGKPRLTKGDDARVYVEGDKGAHVLIVGHDGKIADVPVNGDVVTSSKPVPPPAEPTTVPPPVQQPANNPPPNPPVAPPVNNPPAKKTPPPAPVIVASPPGAPAGVTAVASPGAARVTWGAAPANGAPVTAYVVSWAGGSLEVAGGVLTAQVGGLPNRVSQTFSVRAVNSAGTGPAASAAPVTPVVPPNVALSQGALVECENPENMPCRWMHVVMTGFAPNTSYRVIARRAEDDWANDHEPNRVTNASGNVTFDGFYYYGVGATVWVEVTTPEGTIRSNQIVWR